VPEIDRQMAQMPLARFQETFLMDQTVNTMAIMGAHLSDIVAAGPRLRALAARHDAVYLDWGELAPAVKQAITLDISTAMMMYVTLVVVVVFIILNTLYMSVLERTREFGVLLAIGMKPGQIGRMVWLEMIFLSIAGTGIGVLLGVGVTLFFSHQGIAFEALDEVYAQWGLPSRFYPMMSPLSVLLGPGAIVTAITVLGFIPYRRVLGLEPVSAMAA